MLSAEVASTSGRPQVTPYTPSHRSRGQAVRAISNDAQQGPHSAKAAPALFASLTTVAPAAVAPTLAEQDVNLGVPLVVTGLLPEKDFGVLRGGRYPFLYDPVYGLPVVHRVASYGEVLRDVRMGKVSQVLMFHDPVSGNDPGGRCLVRYTDGGVAQSVLPEADERMTEALTAFGVSRIFLPPEPRHIPGLAGEESPQRTGLVGKLQNVGTAYLHIEEPDGIEGRLGPRIGPTDAEVVAALMDREARDGAIESDVADTYRALEDLQRMPTEDWEAIKRESIASQRVNTAQQNMTSALQRKAARGAPKRPTSWSDRIIISQDTQALILKYAPIIGPIVGSAFILGLYLLARLVKGDLTDRMKMMGAEDEKKKRTALKEARIAFLEEEVPALVARGDKLDAVLKRAVEINRKLGPKLELADSEVASTYEACQSLLEQGIDLAGAAGSASAASSKLAAIEQEAADAIAKSGEGASQEAAEQAAIMDMSKMNTARIRKAVDPRIMDVKRRVRAARRSLKRESKVNLSDEIIFFDDVAGNTQAKVELGEVVDFFRQPEKFRASGAKAPKGVLLVGTPGNGKTLMARAVAGEAGVAFISSSAAEFIEMYMGLGAARVRDLFNTARNLSPCIIFIDELDAVGRARQGGGKSNEERDTTVNQLLTEMDGFEAEQKGIVVMAATNRKDVLDAALTRPGRFDRSIEVRRPDYAGRLECLKVHMRDKPAGPDFNYQTLALLTGGMSGAQIAGVCNTACFVASRAGRQEVMEADMVAAIDGSKYGKSYDTTRFVSPNRKMRFAVMEASISLAATLLPAIEPVQYVNIMPSVRSPIGRTVLESHIGRYTAGTWTRRYLREQLLVQLAGRAGEQLVFGVEELSSLQQHRLMFARQIVTKMLNSGFSSHPDFEHIRTLGSNFYDPSSEPGRWQTTTIITDANQSRSEWVDTDMEMEALLNDGYTEVLSMLKRNRAALDELVRVLFEKEEIRGDEVRAVVEKLGHPDDLAARRAEKGLALL